jgi:Zn-dependent protease with chaperone function
MPAERKIPMETVYEKIRVDEEAALLKHLESVFNAPAVTSLLAYKDKIDKDNLLASVMKGYHFPLSEKFGGQLYAICREVAKKLGLGDLNVEFYVCNSPETNAFAMFNHNEGEPHYIVLHSGLIDKLDPDELRFVVGHELGHLVYRHSVLYRVMELIYPNFEDLPPFLQGIHDLWRKLGEISADRLGLLAVRELEPALTAMFKMSSGLSMGYFKMDPKAYLEMIDALMAEMSETGERVFESHPANPVRVKALELFFRSRTWKDWAKPGKIRRDKVLEEKMESTIAVLRKTPRFEKDQAELEFLASAGFTLMVSDEIASEEEYTYLLNLLSYYYFWPGVYLQSYSEAKDPKEIQRTLKRSAAIIVEKYPQSSRTLLQALMPLLTRDKKLDQRELDTLFSIAEKQLKIPHAEVVDLLLDGLVEHFRPMT